MLKALIILDVLQNIEPAEREEMGQMLSELRHLAEFEIYTDETISALENELEHIHRNETEGPNWVQYPEKFLNLVADKDVIITHWTSINRAVIDAAPRLKLIGTLRSGLENIDSEYACEKGISVINCPGRLANSVADLTLAMILSENKGILRRNLYYTRGEWIDWDTYDDAGGRPLCMQTAGLIGFGAISQALAKRLRACGTKVTSYDPYQKDEVFAREGVERVDWDTLLTKSDIITIHVRLTAETKEMLGQNEFARMKPSAIFINTARAGLVNEIALIEALQTKKIRGAGLDVFNTEPIPKDHPYLAMDNVTMTPHCGGRFPGAFLLSLKMMLQTIKPHLEEMGAQL